LIREDYERQTKGEAGSGKTPEPSPSKK